MSADSRVAQPNVEERQMAFFSNADEVYEYIGGVFRAAADHPEVGPKMAAANITLQIYYSDPESKVTIHFTEPKLTAMVNNCVLETTRCETEASPVVKLITAPSPVACLR